MTFRRDKTKLVIRNAKLYIKDEKSNFDENLARVGAYYIYNRYIKTNLGLEEKKVTIGGKKNKIWGFVENCEYLRGEISASRIASLLIKYRRALKELGAINSKFSRSLAEAKQALLKAGVEQKLVNRLNAKLQVKTLEDRIALMKR